MGHGCIENYHMLACIIYYGEVQNYAYDFIAAKTNSENYNASLRKHECFQNNPKLCVFGPSRWTNTPWPYLGRRAILKTSQLLICDTCVINASLLVTSLPHMY